MSISKGVLLYGYTDNRTISPRFDAEGAGLYSMEYENSGLEDIGVMASDRCELSLGVGAVTRDFHLQAYEGEENRLEVKFGINTVSGNVDGEKLDILKQHTVFLNNYTMGYGFVTTGLSIQNRAYVYVSYNNESWMEAILDSAEFKDLLIKDLVLPGSHDAGMYDVVISDGLVATLKEYLNIPSKFAKAGLGLSEVRRIAINLAVTQKDDATAQLKIGVRFFDYRPAYFKKAPHEEPRHIHGVVPGASFRDFMVDIGEFSDSHKKEVVFIEIASSGIIEDVFAPLTREQVEKHVTDYLKPYDVDFEIIDSISNKNNQKLSAIVASGVRIIIIYHPAKVNDSYDEKKYEASLHSTEKVQSALEDMLARFSNSYQYNVLQLQDTGSGFIAKHIDQSLVQWEKVITSDGGSILQYTKPHFDHNLYAWLVQESTVSSIKKCKQPIILLNDFVDPALTSRAIGLTKNRHK